MRPIIIDMNNLSDSTEIYESKPNRFLVYTIYLILLIVVVFFLWMGLYRIDILVNGEGVFRSCISESDTEYYAEIYLRNYDASKIHKGQDVRIETSNYPVSEYGYFIGSVHEISKDIFVDHNTGYIYHVAKIKCDANNIEALVGDEISLMNGMACQAKIVVDDKSILSYFLEKINIIE